MPAVVPIPVTVALTADTGTPAWLTHAVTVAIPAVAIALAEVDPDGKINTAAAQAAVILGGLIIAGIIHIVWLLARNGLSKVGLTRTVSDEETWVRANAGVLRSTFEAAQPALDAIPGVPAALAATQDELAKVRAELAAIPAGQTEAAVAALKSLVNSPGGVATAATPLPVSPPAAA